MKCIDFKLKCKAALGVKEVSTRCETSHKAGGEVAATNKLIKTFCQKYTLVQFFEYSIKSIIARKRLFSQILSHFLYLMEFLYFIFLTYFCTAKDCFGYLSVRLFIGLSERDVSRRCNS